jgi:hypothetical protein
VLGANSGPAPGGNFSLGCNKTFKQLNIFKIEQIRRDLLLADITMFFSHNKKEILNPKSETISKSQYSKF